MNGIKDAPPLVIYLNTNISISCETQVTSNMTLSTLIASCKSKLKVKNSAKCILYDSGGGELSEDDLEFINPEDPLFLSQGEEFSKASSLALYKKISSLGQGGFGSVSLYEHRQSHQKVAIKFIDVKSLTSPEDINRVYTEIGVLRGLNHPNIVKLHEAFMLNEEICFVMEYCSGGELGGYLDQSGPMPEVKLYPLALQIVDAVRYCHNSHIVHRDLKMENILFVNEAHCMIKIVDFGISGIFSPGQSGDKSSAGSMLYIPPEVYKGSDIGANPALDVWAMGCIFYYLLTGRHPFMHDHIKEIVSHIEKAQYEPLPSTITRAWHKLIKGMIRLNPQNRWDIIKIQRHLEKYYDDPDEVVSEDSLDREEVKEEMSKKKAVEIRSSKGMLRVPKIQTGGKSQSPSDRKSLGLGSPASAKKMTPKTPVIEKRKLEWNIAHKVSK